MNNAGNHCPSPGTHSSAAVEVSGGVFVLLQMLMTVGPSCSSSIPKALSIRRGEIETGKCHINETSRIEGLGRLLGRLK